MKKITRFIGFTIFGIAAVLLLFLEIMTLLDYKPAPQTVLAQNSVKPLQKDTINILSWNIGYAGLDAEMDFFYDGGQKTRTGKQQTLNNLDAICEFIRKNDSIDVFLIQEIDQKAKRSYNINQLDYVSKAAPRHAFFFAKDYDVYFVPMPLFNPMGRVVSGIATLSGMLPSECIHHAYPSQGNWPVHLFLLDNCFISSRYPVKNGKDLLIINTHNSAFDDGDKRKVEMEFLRQILLDEYDKGNYVIAGGDWNQTPPLIAASLKYDVDKSMENTKYFNPLPISPDFMPAGWQWISDGKPTNRFLYEPYNKEHTAETLIDFFLASPNIQVINNRTFDLGFSHSDHNPIMVRFTFREEK